jgi:hypothetical protein
VPSFLLLITPPHPPKKEEEEKESLLRTPDILKKLALILKESLFDSGKSSWSDGISMK